MKRALVLVFVAALCGCPEQQPATPPTPPGEAAAEPAAETPSEQPAETPAAQTPPTVTYYAFDG